MCGPETLQVWVQCTSIYSVILRGETLSLAEPLHNVAHPLSHLSEP